LGGAFFLGGRGAAGGLAFASFTGFGGGAAAAFFTRSRLESSTTLRGVAAAMPAARRCFRTSLLSRPSFFAIS
jgi:hypothetical protein